MAFTLTLTEWLLATLITTAGAALQGAVGFGMGLLAVPLLILIEPDFVPGPLLLAAFFLNVLVSIRERESVDFSSIKWVIGGRLLGTVVAAAVLTVLPKSLLSLLFGGLILLAVLFSISGLHISLKPGNLVGIGAISGFMATSTAVGGPPLALLYQREKGPRLRGNLAGIFFVGTIMAIISLMVIGRFGLKELVLALSFFPAIIIGFLLSGKPARFLDVGRIRIAVLAISTLSALVVILKTVL
jgi:uncharacterized membrane protein YfcA